MLIPTNLRLRQPCIRSESMLWHYPILLLRVASIRINVIPTENSQTASVAGAATWAEWRVGFDDSCQPDPSGVASSRPMRGRERKESAVREGQHMGWAGL